MSSTKTPRNFLIWSKTGENAWWTANVRLAYEEAAGKIHRFETASRLFSRGGLPCTQYEIRPVTGYDMPAASKNPRTA